MGELIKREAATAPLPFAGERLTSAISGQVEIEHYHRYLLAREFCRGLDVLDVAAGEGYGTALLAQVARSAVGIEVDPEVVAAARREFRYPTLHYEQGDARNIPLPDASIDIAVSFETLEHFIEQDKFLSELRRVLRPDGLLIISTPDRDIYSPANTPPNPYHANELTRAEFEAALTRHFSHVKLAAQRAIIGSVIIGAANNVSARSYERRGDTLIEGDENLIRAPYLVALASNVALPPLPHSVYVHRSDLDTDSKSRFEAEELSRAAERHLDELRRELAQSMGQVAEAERRDELKKNQLRTTEESFSQATERERQAVAELHASRAEIVNLRLRTDEARAAFEIRIAELQRSLVTIASRAQSTAERISAQAEFNATAHAQIAKLESQLLAADGRAEEGKAREANARRHIASLEQGNEHLKATLLLVERDRDVSHREAGELAQRLTAIETSSAWRATGPLRRAGSRFPTLARAAGRAAKIVWWTATLQIYRRYSVWRDCRQLSKVGHATALDASPAELIFGESVVTGQVPPDEHSELGSWEFRVPFSDDPLVSVIISTYGQLSATMACLKSISEYAPSYPIEVLVVDDFYTGPEDMSGLAAVTGIRYFRNAKNLGFLLSCNAAARQAKGSFLYFLNNDTELRPHSIDALVSLLESRSDVGMAGSKLLFPDGKLQEAGGIVWRDASGWNYGRGDNPSLAQYNYVREVDYCSGASIMIRRELFELLGGFDEEFAPAYYEDTDLAFRVRAHGMKVAYEPRSTVIHHEGLSHGTDVESGIKSYQSRNQARFLKRWKATLENENYANSESVIRARDRARLRKMILVIDHYVPEPDRDAGSRSMMGILDSLIDAGWLVKFWPHNRAYQPVYSPALERKGIEVLDHRFKGDLKTWLGSHGSELDHLLVSRPDVAEDVIETILQRTRAVLSFYGHDLHFQRMRRQAVLNGDLMLQLLASEMEQREREIWKKFDVVLYPSEEEAAIVRKMSPHSLVRSIVPFFFDVFPERPAAVEGHSVLFVAGFAHPPNVDAAHFLVGEIVPLLERKIGPVKVVLAGSNPTEDVKNLAGPNVKVTGYVTEEALAELYHLNRVSVVPLRFGAGVKGKVVEALSRGLPLVTTSIGSEGIPELDSVVPVYDKAADIAESLGLLLTDDVVWMSQSRSQMRFAQHVFSREAMQRSVLSGLEDGEASRNCMHDTAASP